MNEPVSCAHINYGLDFIAERFLRSTALTWSDNVLEVMAHLGMAAGFGRVTAYKHHRPVDDPVKTGLRYVWIRDGDSREILDNEEDLKTMSGDVLEDWKNRLWKNEVVIVESGDSPEEARSFFGDDMQSAMLVPVFVDEKWWGFFGYEDRHERQWSSDEVETLKAVATIYGSAIWRKRLEEELEHQNVSVEQQVQERTKQLEAARSELEVVARRAQDQKARLLASIQSLSMGFVMTDVEGNVTLVNDAVRRILRMHDGALDTLYALDGVLGQGDILQTKMKECVKEVQATRIDEIHYQDSYLDIWLTPITTLDGNVEVIGLVLLIDDVTEAKMLQKSRDEFFAVASHELRTPLTAIRGNASMMLDYYPEHMKDPQLKEMVNDIHDSSKRLIDIVNEYLDVSRLEMDHVKLALEPIDLIAVCKNVMESIQVNANEKGLQFELQEGDLESLTVWGDMRRVQQILFNLIGNAIKYTDNGGVYVKVEQLGDMGRVVVYDTGNGISEEKQHQLFQKFSQLGDREYQNRVREDSTGMGLYITKLIAEAMNAKVYLEKSIPGEGSGFALELRFAGDKNA